MTETPVLKHLTDTSFTHIRAQLSPQSPSGSSGLDVDGVVLSEQQNNNSTNKLASGISERDALDAMLKRGIDGPELLIPFAAPDRIIGACEWFDRQNGVRTGLLVWKIKQGGADRTTTPNSGPSLRAKITYDDTALPLFFTAHADWEWRREYPVSCETGRLMIVEAAFPVLTLECDACGFLAGLPHRKLTPTLLAELGVSQEGTEL